MFLFFVFAHLSSSSAIAISGAVEEFVIVMVEFPFIVNDPVALILICMGLRFVYVLFLFYIVIFVYMVHFGMMLRQIRL